MPIDQQLLDILCCPETKVDVQPLATDDLKQLNEAIKKGSVKNKAGKAVTTVLAEGLITVDRKTIYRIDNDIPVMLIDEGIPFHFD